MLQNLTANNTSWVKFFTSAGNLGNIGNLIFEAFSLLSETIFANSESAFRASISKGSVESGGGIEGNSIGGVGEGVGEGVGGILSFSTSRSLGIGLVNSDLRVTG